MKQIYTNSLALLFFALALPTYGKESAPANDQGLVIYGTIGASYNTAKFNPSNNPTWIQLSQLQGGVNVTNQISSTPHKYGLNLSLGAGYNIPFHCCWSLEPRFSVTYDSANLRTLSFKGTGNEFFIGHTFPRWRLSAGFVIGRLVRKNLKIYAGLLVDYGIYYYTSKSNFGPSHYQYITKKEKLWGVTPLIGVSTQLTGHLRSFFEASWSLALQNKNIVLGSGLVLKKRYSKKPQSFALKAGIGYTF